MSVTRTPIRNARREQDVRRQPADPTTIAVYALVGLGLIVMMIAVWLDVIKVAAR